MSGERTKEQFREYVMGSEVPKKRTLEEAFEAGKSSDMSGYDANGCKCCREIMRYFNAHPDILVKCLRWRERSREVLNAKYGTADALAAAFIGAMRECGIPRWAKYLKDGEKKDGCIGDRWSIITHFGVDHTLHCLGQDAVMHGMDLIDGSDLIIKKVMDDVGPTTFMWSWAYNSALWLSEGGGG